MSVNPLVAAIGAFSQGEMQGRESRRKRDAEAAEIERNEERTRRAETRQGTLDAALQQMQEFQLQAPTRAEEQRQRLLAEQRAERERRRQALEKAMAGDAAAKADVAEFDPTLVDKLLTPAKVEEEKFTGQPFEMGKDDNVQPGLYIRGDKGTVKYVGRAPKKEMSPAAAMVQGQRAINNTNSLRDDFANEPTIKTAKAYASAYQGIQAAARDDNPQTSLAMMYEAVKMRDPNAVREGELGLQLRARGVPQWLDGFWSRAARGEILTDTERRQIVDWARTKLEEQNSVVQPIQQTYGSRLRQLGQTADSAFVAPSPFRGTGVGTGKPHERY